MSQVDKKTARSSSTELHVLPAFSSKDGGCNFLLFSLLKRQKNNKKKLCKNDKNIISTIIQYNVRSFNGTIVTKRSVCKNNNMGTSPNKTNTSTNNSQITITITIKYKQKQKQDTKTQ